MKFIDGRLKFKLVYLFQICRMRVCALLTKHFILPNSTKNDTNSLYKKQVYHAEISNAVFFYFIGAMHFRATEPGEMELQHKEDRRQNL